MRLTTRTPLVTILSAALLVACGDDESVGTGGAGGTGSSSATSSPSSTSSTSSASSSASGSTSSSSTTSTGEGAGGGSGGAGGEGGGSGVGGEGGGAGGAGGGASFVCQPEASEGAAVTVVTVDENGDEVPVSRVLWQDQPADPFWLEPEAASCAGGAEPPCSVWEIADYATGRIIVTSSRTTEAEGDCIPFASTFVTVHPGSARQLVHLTLPSDGTYCIDPKTGRAVVNVEHDEQVDDTDCLAPPPDVAGPITVDVIDQDGEPAPATIAHWYYHPESEDYDGEHPLACADQRCTSWVVTESPLARTIILTADYVGPLNPFIQTGWSGYDSTSFEVELDDDGAIIPVSATIQLRTVDESAIGG